MDDIDVVQANRELEQADPAATVAWAWRTFSPSVAASSSFQTQSLVLLHLIARVAPEMEILFLDTGFHFPETLAYRDRLTRELGLRVRVLKPAMGHDGFRRHHGELYRTDPDMCCYINKVEPMQRALAGLDAWVTGIRRDQTAQRRDTPVVARLDDGTYKVAPLAAWEDRDVWRYIETHDLPPHPLLEEGYLSIGCAPCTRPVGIEQSRRSGRWAGREKTECGLHGVSPEPGGA